MLLLKCENKSDATIQEFKELGRRRKGISNNRILTPLRFKPGYKSPIDGKG
jgi:hypothetical protein